MSKTLGVTSNAWILFAAAFLASRYRSPEIRKAPRMTDGSGQSSGALWAFYDRATSSWKMSQVCLPLTEDTLSVRSSVTWPTSGMTVNGRCYPLPTWAHRTSESASGSWPTPTASTVDMYTMEQQRTSGTYRAAHRAWPPPTAGAAKRAGNRNSEHSKAHAGVSLTGESSTPRSEVSGQLNPTWVEWLMGFPDGWTDYGD